MGVKEFEQLHVQANFNREGKAYTKRQLKRKEAKFRKLFRADVKLCGGGAKAAEYVLQTLTAAYDAAGTPSPYVLSVQFPHAQNLIWGKKVIELRKTPPGSPFDVDGPGCTVLLAQSKSKSKFLPHPAAGDYGERQDGRVLGQITIVAFGRIMESDLCEDLALQCALTLDSLKKSWHAGYKFGWIMESALPFSKPPVTYDLTTTKGTRMGTIFTIVKDKPLQRALRV